MLSLYQRLLLCILSSSPIFPKLSEESSRRTKTKGQKQKATPFQIHFKLSCQVFPSLCFLPREFISPCESIFRKLQSSIIHETSQNRTYHQVYTWEIKCYHPFQLLLSSVWKMCAGASQQCEITPLGGQRKGSQPQSVTWIPFSVPHLSWLFCSAQARLAGMSFLRRTINWYNRYCFSLPCWEKKNTVEILPSSLCLGSFTGWLSQTPWTFTSPELLF